MNPPRSCVLLASLAVLALAAGARTAAAQADTLLSLQSGSPATDRFRVDSAGGVLMAGTIGRGSIPASGAGARLMWYPRKGALRAGLALSDEWDDPAVGLYSTALGYGPRASGSSAVALGYRTAATGDWSTAIGYRALASGQDAVAIGEYVTASGPNSTAMGRYSSTNGRWGAFVYSDASTADTVRATANHQFTVRASGGVRFFTNYSQSAGVLLAAGGGSWTTVSDRSRKEDFLPLDGEDVLARIRRVPLSSWRYIAEEDRGVRHIGPMAQDWHAAFPELGGDGRTINQGDVDGVNLAGVQALEARTAAQAERLGELSGGSAALAERTRRLEEENELLRSRVERLEAALSGAHAAP
jgi:trimeric autotransporter adhesin